MPSREFVRLILICFNKTQLNFPCALFQTEFIVQKCVSITNQKQDNDNWMCLFVYVCKLNCMVVDMVRFLGFINIFINLAGLNTPKVCIKSNWASTTAHYKVWQMNTKQNKNDWIGRLVTFCCECKTLVSKYNVKKYLQWRVRLWCKWLIVRNSCCP